MPRTIEHKIKIIGSSNPSGNVSEYGTIEREKNGTLNSQENKKSLNRKADEISYGTECFERNLHYSPNEIEREQFSCRNFGEHYSLGNKAKNLRHQNEHKPEAIKVNYNYDNSNPFSHPIHNDDEYVFESDEDISENEIKGKEELSPTKQFNYKNNEIYNNQPLQNFTSLPMKKIIKKSRFVSIHDGRPVSDFVETVHYEPINYYNKSYSQTSSSPLPTKLEETKLLNYCSSSSCSLSEEDEHNKNKTLKKKKDRKNDNKIFNRPVEKVYLTQNPLFSS